MKKIASVFLLAILFTALFVPAASGAAGDSELSYVVDDANLLSPAQLNELEDRAKNISEQYGCEVRIITVKNMRDYNFTDIEKFSYNIYKENDLGYGPDKSCAILLLSMRDRDYDLRVWGYGKVAFTFYGIDAILDRHILPPLGDNEYYKAFSIYLDKSEMYLKMARDGTPFDKGNDPETAGTILAVKLAVTIIVPLIIALIICSIWKGKMKTAKIAKVADDYIPPNGFNLTVQGDMFLYRTVTRRRIETSSSSSGGGASSGIGGSSGRSGKF